MATDTPSPIARALGRIPCGLYIVTTNAPEGPLGFLGSFVAQVGFEPPTVCIAVGRDRDHLAAMRASGRFALSILGTESGALMKPFFGSEDPFMEVATTTTDAGSTVLDGALAWLDCQISGEHDVGDHIVVFGEVQAASLQEEGDPKIHLRKSGLGY